MVLVGEMDCVVREAALFDGNTETRALFLILPLNHRVTLHMTQPFFQSLKVKAKIVNLP